MTPFENLFARPDISTGLYMFLVWLTVKAGVIVGLALMVTAVFRRATSARLHLALATAIIGVAAMPILTVFFPEWQLGVFKNLPPTFATKFFVTCDSSATTTIGDGQSAGMSWTLWAVGLWMLGSIFILVRTAFGLIATAGLVRRARIISEGNLVALKDECQKKFGIRRPVRLAVSLKVTSPFVWGIFRPVIIIPEPAEKWSNDDIRLVMLHELAHVRRFDSVWLILTALVAAIYWINPLIWIAKKRLIIEAEKTCDDHVLNAGTDETTYAQHLLNVLSLLRQRQGVVPVGVGMARKSHLEGRLMSILSSRKRSVSQPKSVVIIAVLAAFIAVVPLAVLQVQAGEDSDTVKRPMPSPDEFVPVEVMPEMTYMESPTYPEEALKTKLEGVVWVRVLVNKEGAVVKASVHKTSGHEMFDDAALEVAYKNKFKPGVQKGNPVACWVSYKVAFELDGKDDEKEKKEKGDG